MPEAVERKKPSRRPARALPLSAARLAAVQALYQMELAGTDAHDVVQEFCQHRISDETDASCCQQADEAHFRAIVHGVVRDQRRIDPLLNERLAEGWRLPRIDSILRAILRSAAYELLSMPQTPARVVINEYVDVARAFFDDGEEPGAVNAILDRLSRELRKDEFREPTDV
ncbi:MAG: transcription antitermination factor NusB [Methyloligellaceae bacterium]